jgi:hypothetical protein
MHAVKQAVVPLQTYGWQLTGEAGLQVPVPLHVGAGVNMLVVWSQRASPHGVPGGYMRQAPAPLHLPSVPQVCGSVTMQTPCGSETPAGTDLHMPCVPGPLQATQAPLHCPSQQTPSAHQPLKHCAGSVHGAPSGRRHFPPRQVSALLHIWPHWPQLALSPEVSVQPSEQQVCGAEHAPLPSQRHCVPTHWLFCVQAGTQVVCTHLPIMQAKPLVQTVMQSPQ